MELAATDANIDVVVVYPSSINTPFYTWRKSNIGVRPHPISRIYPPEKVAAAIVRAAAHPRRDLYVGVMGKLLSIGQRISPRLLDAYMLQADRMFREQASDRRDARESNLFRAPNDTDIEGEFTDESTARWKPLVATLGTIAGIATVVLLRNRRK